MIALACDHVALSLKAEIIALLEERGISYRDYGTNSNERTDYPVYAQKVAHAVASGECERGIIICGTGVGMSIAANKIKGIRCVVCSDCYSAKLSRQHNNTNILSLGARVVGADLAKMIAEIWLSTDYEGDRHQRRLDQITELENNQALKDGSPFEA